MNKQLLLTVLRRGVYSVMILFFLVSFVFILLRISPGDPVSKYVSPGISPQLAENIKESFGLNEPLILQYLIFLGNTFSGDLGSSFNYRMPVISVIAEFLPFTIMLALISFTLQVSLALMLALRSAAKRGTIKDKIISEANLVVYAVPSFVTGVMLIFFFSEILGLFPSAGIRSVNYENMGFLAKIYDSAKHLILPLLTLTVGGTTVLYRYLRENMDEIFNSDFVLYLRSNGIGDKEIIRKHVLPNAVSPLISIAGIELGILFSGALITEVIFGLPGMGRLTVQAIMMRDYPLVTGCVLTSGILVIASSFIADFIKIRMDKRLISKGILD
jgi:peptide/nickel transport system permease protein